MVLSNRLPALAEEYAATASQLVRKAAFDIESLAKRLARVDTGALRNSIYAVVGGESEYAGAVSSAIAAAAAGGIRSGPHNIEVFDPVELFDLRPGNAIVAVGVKYGAIVEYTIQPFMTPAAEAVLPQFQEALRQMLERGGYSTEGLGRVSFSSAGPLYI